MIKFFAQKLRGTSDEPGETAVPLQRSPRMSRKRSGNHLAFDAFRNSGT